MVHVVLDFVFPTGKDRTYKSTTLCLGNIQLCIVRYQKADEESANHILPIVNSRDTQNDLVKLNSESHFSHYGMNTPKESISTEQY